MSTPIERPVTPERLFLWVMHRFAEVFGHRAILKGGMALRLYDSPRSTTDIDYVFAPFRSKRDIMADFGKTLAELDGATVDVEVHSKMLRANVEMDGVRIQVEANVAAECASESMATGNFARSLGQASHVVRVMSPGLALANKLAAWNERRLHRELYDTYFLISRAGAVVDMDALRARLGKIESRLPALHKVRSMTTVDFASQLRCEVADLKDEDLREELAAILPESELAGLLPRIRSALVTIAELLERRG